jgi:hypothetical protein
MLCIDYVLKNMWQRVGKSFITIEPPSEKSLNKKAYVVIIYIYIYIYNVSQLS